MVAVRRPRSSPVSASRGDSASPGGRPPQTPRSWGDAIPPDPPGPPSGGTFPGPLRGEPSPRPPWSGVAGDLGGVLGGAAADLGAEPDQGVVPAVGHAFL